MRCFGSKESKWRVKVKRDDRVPELRWCRGGGEAPHRWVWVFSVCSASFTFTLAARVPPKSTTAHKECTITHMGSLVGRLFDRCATDMINKPVHQKSNNKKSFFWLLIFCCFTVSHLFLHLYSAADNCSTPAHITADRLIMEMSASSAELEGWRQTCNTHNNSYYKGVKPVGLISDCSFTSQTWQRWSFCFTSTRRYKLSRTQRDPHW